AHQLHAFGRHYTSIPRPKVEAPSRRFDSEARPEASAQGYGEPREAASTLTPESVFAALRRGPLRITSPPASFVDLFSAIWWIFLAHPFRRRRHQDDEVRITNSEGKAHNSTVQVSHEVH